MPFITVETRIPRTWRERLFTKPWRPWRSHTVTREVIWRAPPKADHTPYRSPSYKSPSPSPVQPAPRPEVMSVQPRRRDDDDFPLTQLQSGLSPLLFEPSPAPAPSECRAEDFRSGGGGEFGGGGASGSWDSGSSSDSSSSSSSSSSGD